MQAALSPLNKGKGSYAHGELKQLSNISIKPHFFGLPVSSSTCSPLLPVSWAHIGTNDKAPAFARSEERLSEFQRGADRFGPEHLERAIWGRQSSFNLPTAFPPLALQPPIRGCMTPGYPSYNSPSMNRLPKYLSCTPWSLAMVCVSVCHPKIIHCIQLKRTQADASCIVHNRPATC